MAKIKIGDEVYWMYDGDVIKGVIIGHDGFNYKLKTEEGLVFGKVFPDNDPYDIWEDDLATTREAAIKIVKKRLKHAKITVRIWQVSLDDLICGRK
ncbi:hypothetical protein JZU46_06195 [bacterium]|nr:hypothetical protein [bacterium]